MSTPILKAVGLKKSYRHPTLVEILKGVDLEVMPGESVAIMGASGEGKSTLLQILGTLEKPDEGVLEIAGKRSASPAKLRNRYLGFVFQGFHLLEDTTPLQNVLMPALIGGQAIHKRSNAYKRATQLLEHVGLSSRMHFPVKLLSGGEKQRVAIARAFCNSPELLLADEPSGNLDHTTSQEIHTLLLNSVQEEKKALIVVTHDNELARLCDRVLVLKGGIWDTNGEDNGPQIS